MISCFRDGAPTLAAVHAPAVRRQAFDSAPSGCPVRCPPLGSVSVGPPGALDLGVFRTTRGGRAMKVKSQTKSVVRRLLVGLAAVLVIGGHARDARAANV